jgi:hypothetical protein
MNDTIASFAGGRGRRFGIVHYIKAYPLTPAGTSFSLVHPARCPKSSVLSVMVSIAGGESTKSWFRPATSRVAKLTDGVFASDR